MTMDINWLAVLVAGVVTFLLGGLWYRPLFGKVWRTAAGQAEPEPDNRKHPALVYGLSFVLMLIGAAALAITIGPAPTVTKAVGAGLIIGVGWVFRGELPVRGETTGAVRSRCRLQRRAVRGDGIGACFDRLRGAPLGSAPARGFTSSQPSA